MPIASNNKVACPLYLSPLSEFWKKNQNMIQETIKKTKMDEVDRMEIILQAVSDKESKI